MENSVMKSMFLGLAIVLASLSPSLAQTKEP
jgi:hypothetical protein